MSDREPIIRLRNVEVSYSVRKQLFSRQKRRIHALKDLTFDVYRGEKLGVIGRNGCGKSTLFKLLAGIFEPDSGTLAMEPGLNVQLLSLGVGFEGNLTGRENAILNGMLLGKSRQYMKARADYIREFSELGEFFEMPVFTYSSGMNARLGFSVALEADPDVLLIDEVLGVGDAHFAEKSEKAMLERFDSDATIILVTHDHNMIQRFCDRAVWIEDGVSVRVGDVMAVTKGYLDSLDLEGSEDLEHGTPPTDVLSPPGAPGNWDLDPHSSIANCGGSWEFERVESMRFRVTSGDEWLAVNVWDCESAQWVKTEHENVYNLSEIVFESLPENRWYGLFVWSYSRSSWSGVYFHLKSSAQTQSRGPIHWSTRRSPNRLGRRTDLIWHSVDIKMGAGPMEGMGWFSARHWAQEDDQWKGAEDSVFEPETVLYENLELGRWQWLGLWSYHRSSWLGGSWVGLFPCNETDETGV